MIQMKCSFYFIYLFLFVNFALHFSVEREQTAILIRIDEITPKEGNLEVSL